MRQIWIEDLKKAEMNAIKETILVQFYEANRQLFDSRTLLQVLGIE